MRDLTSMEQAKITAHAQWLNDPTIEQRVDFSCADLRYADLHDADLRHATSYPSLPPAAPSKPCQRVARGRSRPSGRRSPGDSRHAPWPDRNP